MSKHAQPKKGNIHFIEEQEIIVKDFTTSGYILDIGGGGEGVIGQLKGNKVIAIDPNKSELEEAPSGPLKIVMDATDLQFLDGSFNVITSFFTLLYINPLDQEKVFQEANRVLKANGRFLVWDVDLPKRMAEKKEIVAFYVKIILPDREIYTGYGNKWPELRNDLSLYKKMGEGAGFVVSKQSENGRLFFLEFKKV